MDRKRLCEHFDNHCTAFLWPVRVSKLNHFGFFKHKNSGIWTWRCSDFFFFSNNL